MWRPTTAITTMTTAMDMDMGIITTTIIMVTITAKRADLGHDPVL